METFVRLLILCRRLLSHELSSKVRNNWTPKALGKVTPTQSLALRQLNPREIYGGKRWFLLSCLCASEPGDIGVKHFCGLLVKFSCLFGSCLHEFNVFLFQRFHCLRDQTSITMVDVKCLSDYELQNKLNKLGYSPGPILRTYAANIRD